MKFESVFNINNLIFLHQMLKSNIQKKGYIATFKECKELFKFTQFDVDKKVSAKKVIAKTDKLIKQLLCYEEKGYLVTSCISLSILSHLMLFINGIKSEIKIGVFITNESNIISHAWVECENNILNYHYDNINYSEILTLDLSEEV